MNRVVNAISGRLSLRPPQRKSLKILDRICEIADPTKATDLATAVDVIQSEYPSVTDFERDFPSLCFALATGVGKTRLMGSFISYLYLTKRSRPRCGACRSTSARATSTTWLGPMRPRRGCSWWR